MWGISALSHARVAFPYLGNGWTDCAKVLFAVRDQLARQLTQTNCEVQVTGKYLQDWSLRLSALFHDSALGLI